MYIGTCTCLFLNILTLLRSDVFHMCIARIFKMFLLKYLFS
eukprot:UN05216